jgi:hypothetical protein
MQAKAHTPQQQQQQQQQLMTLQKMTQTCTLVSHSSLNRNAGQQALQSVMLVRQQLPLLATRLALQQIQVQQQWHHQQHQSTTASSGAASRHLCLTWCAQESQQMHHRRQRQLQQQQQQQQVDGRSRVHVVAMTLTTMKTSSSCCH